MKAPALAWLTFAVCCAFASSANAQDQCPAFKALIAANRNNPCMWEWAWDSLPVTNGPSNMLCCNLTNDLFGDMCIAPRQSCKLPSNVANDTCPTCSKQLPINPPEVGSPINLATGNTYIGQSD